MTEHAGAIDYTASGAEGQTDMPITPEKYVLNNFPPVPPIPPVFFEREQNIH